MRTDTHGPTKLCALGLSVLASVWLSSEGSLQAQPVKAHAVIHREPLQHGQIDPKLFGNFIELLDDLVPAMWAELLNDRSFEGVIPQANWCYFDGSPDFCDREWNTNATWSLDSESPFNGARCARLTANDSVVDPIRPGNKAGEDLSLFRVLPNG